MISFLKNLFNRPIIIRGKSPQRVIDITDYNNQTVYFNCDLFQNHEVILKGKIKDILVINIPKNKASYGRIDINDLHGGNIVINTQFPIDSIAPIKTLKQGQKIYLYIKNKPFKYSNQDALFDYQNNIILHSGNMSFELKTKNQMTHCGDHVVLESLDKLNPEYIKLKEQYLNNLHHLI